MRQRDTYGTRGGSGYRTYTRNRGGYSGDRSTTRQRDTYGTRGGSGYRTYTRNHGGTSSTGETRYRSGYTGNRTYRGGYDRSRYYGGYRSGYGSRFYYTSGFYRPRYHYCNDFSIGLSIGLTPIYGYGYYDPYCGISFATLGGYYDHCGGFSHPTAIVIVDSSLRAPVATCVYHSGQWVVDDCGDRDDGYSRHDSDEDDDYYYEDDDSGDDY